MLKQKAFFRTAICLCGLLGGVIFSLPEAILATNETEVTEFVHKVLPGESLNKIAHQYLPLTKAFSIGDLVEQIKKLNGIHGSLIRTNQDLRIPLAPARSVTARTIPKDEAFEARGIFLNRYSIASPKMGRLIDNLIASKGNTVVIDGKDMAGRLSYRSRVNFAQEIGANTRPFIGDPPRFFQYLHKKGLHIAVRLVLFYDPLLAAKKPELTLRTTTGAPVLERGQAAWVDPSQPSVQRYNLDIAKELAEMGADEIQFDYIRFPTTRSSRHAVYGTTGQKIPRHVIIADFLAEARQILKPYKVLLSIDVFGVLAWGSEEDVEATGQKLEELARYCDVISPMIYPSHFDSPFQGIAHPRTQPFPLISEACQRFSTYLEGSNATLRPWIQAFPWRARNFGKNYIIEELRALDQSEARGWLLWSAGNAYRTAWKALAQWNETNRQNKIVSIEAFIEY